MAGVGLGMHIPHCQGRSTQMRSPPASDSRQTKQKEGGRRNDDGDVVEGSPH